MSDKVDGKVLLKNVRLSFAALFEPDEMTQDDGTVRRTFKANFLIPKDTDDEDAQRNLKLLKDMSAKVKNEKWGSKDKWPKIKADRIFLRDGDQENWDGYAGNWYVSSNRSEKQGPPPTITNRKDADGKWVRAKPGEAGCPYSGCYVNAQIRIWVQDNKHGLRLNASLESVQFLRDGEAFGGRTDNPDDVYDDDDVGEYGEMGDDGDGDLV